MNATAEALLRGLLRGEEEPFEVVERLGGTTTGGYGNLRLQLPADVPTVELPLSDLAHGLLHHWSRGTSLQKWAAVVLAVNMIQFVESDSQAENRLLEALWSAAAGEPIGDDAVALAGSLTH